MENAGGPDGEYSSPEVRAIGQSCPQHGCNGGAKLGGADRRRAVIRNIAGGLIAMGVTYAIGSLVGQSIG